MLLAASLTSWVSLCFRYQKKGKPFGTRASTSLACLVIIATALLATVIGVALPDLIPVSFSIAVFIPALLCAERLGKGNRELHLVEGSAWYGVITLGVALMIGWLEDQMAEDRDDWALRVISGIHGPDELDALESTADVVYDRLSHLSSSPSQLTKLASDYADIGPAIGEARRARSLGDMAECREHTHKAREALRIMLGHAYEWRHTKFPDATGSPPPRRGLYDRIRGR